MVLAASIASARLAGCLAVALTAGCGSAECTTMECTTGLELRFRGPIDRNLSVSFGLVVDDAWTECTWFPDLQLDDCNEIEVSLEMTRDEITGLVLKQIHPALLGVRISVDGTRIIDARLTPHYASVQPNGPQCSPTCHIGYEEV